jgi:hypothetical protein
MINILKCIVFVFLILSNFNLVIAQDDLIDSTIKDKNVLLLEDLNVLKKNISNTKKRINYIKRKFNSEKSQSRKKIFENELYTLSNDLNKLESDFVFLSTGFRIEVNSGSEDRKKVNLVDDFQDLLAPIIQSLRRVSERPRKIEGLRNDILHLEEENKELRQGINNISNLIKVNKINNVNSSLKKTKRFLVEELESNKITLQSAQKQLDKELKSEDSIINRVGSLIGNFLKTKGKNVLLALLFFSLSWWIVSVGFRKLLESEKLGKHIGEIRRSFEIISSGLSLFVGLISALGVLYLLNDWLLVTVFVLVFTVIALSFKQFAPRYVEEARLILNLGTVRESERITYQGIPWTVKKIGVQCLLENPHLTNGLWRIRAKDLVSFSSRSTNATERLFPSKLGDWVIVDDKYYGKVEEQTPEYVNLRLIEGSSMYFKTNQYLEKNIENLSDGYAITFSFGIDYKHQKLVTTDIPISLQSYMNDIFKEYLEKEKPEVGNIKVDFDYVSDHSLKLFVRVFLHGNASHSKERYSRKIQATLVDFCNKNSLRIPFQQLHVSMSDTSLNR